MSGARGESSEHRSPLQNKRAASKRMVATSAFRFWAAQELRRIDGLKSIEQQVDESMRPEHLRVERRGGDGRWQEWDGESSD